MKVFRAAIAFLAVASFASQPVKNRTIRERLEDVRLEAVHDTRVKWMRDRVIYPPLGIYDDYRVIIFGHPDDFPKSPTGYEQVVDAARQDAVHAILYAAPDAEGQAWTGLHNGVLLAPGARQGEELCFPRNCDVRFFLPPGSVSGAPAGSSGVAIYGSQTDDFESSLSAAADKNTKRLLKRATDRRKQYPDEVLGALAADPTNLPLWDAETEKKPFTAIAIYDPPPGGIAQNNARAEYEAAMRRASTHVLALRLSEENILKSLRAGRAYVAFDWLCDPAGFSFMATNPLGAFEIGDRAPLVADTKLVARFPVPASARLIHKGRLVGQQNGRVVEFTATEPGGYRLEAWLEVDGEQRPWIVANPIYLYRPEGPEFALPVASLAPKVEAFGDVPYAGDQDESDLHKLDLYLPQGAKNFPVLVFLHGGGGPMGDRRTYTYIGNRFAAEGIGVVIPSYRMQPASDPPAQIEDAAAAVAWVRKHIAGYGGDPARIYVAGHSTGGQLAALLALDPKYLAAHEMKPADIRGVIGISGIYRPPATNNSAVNKTYAPLEFVNNSAPPFLVAYCQWDYLGLARQARELDAALRRNFVGSKTVFLEGENHISELIHLSKQDNPLAQAIMGFVRSAAPR